tara:strand:+ start:530 stop:1462 length:933 start_codon:yes stop_codon:yes gene_type:complete
MKFIKPGFWDKKNISIITIFLWPFSFLFYVLSYLRKITSVSNNFEIPIICVGNIYIGGTGKTPLSIMLAKDLKTDRKKPVIIRKYYKSHTDEYSLIKSATESLITDKSRTLAINQAINKNYNIAILDDGFQDYSIKKNLNIVCFNTNQLIGNGLLLPAGPLREGLSNLKYAQIIILNGKKNKKFEEQILKVSNNIKIFYSNYSPVNLDDFKGKKLFAFASIGNPENFFNLLEENKLNIHKKKIFPDHYELKAEELKQLIIDSKNNNYELITTEKDYYKIKKLGFDKVKYLKVKLQVEEREKFFNEIKKYI